MGWRDEWLGASLDGATFDVHQAQDTIGRRNVLQKFPGRSTVKGQDLGAEADSFRLSCRIRGADYKTRRLALEDVLRTDGPKTLIHPSRGQIIVELDTGTVEFRDDWSQEVTFDLDCTAAQDVQVHTVDVSDDVLSSIELLTSQAYITQGAHVTGLLRERHSMSFFAAVGIAQNALGAALANVYSRTRVVRDVAAQLETFTETVGQFSAIPSDALQFIGQITGSIFDSTLEVSSALDNVSRRFADGRRVDALIDVAQYLASTEALLAPLTPGVLRGSVSLNDPLSVQQHAAVITASVRIGAIATLGDLLTDLDIESRDQAERARRALRALFLGSARGAVDALAHAVDDETHGRLDRVVSSVSRYLTSTAADLPSIRRIELLAPVCAITVAHHLYGDATRWSEIVVRNGITTPSQIPAGTVIEYIGET